ncbi:NADH-quinone oxidoreductase subunit C [Acidiphilium sp. PA]|uniref:hydrogenase large subunit n=1 Tax=Acidiphilium sp. PA TaxID=2871705 RepID=UPI00224454FD|nr:NADH-quinone oxidoreductase subunit C [Acidiphilium sp. PA]MCW8306086.1 NADH-quinone oxidoreductase subunit C [Acidiphilium sp. PA]
MTVAPPIWQQAAAALATGAAVFVALWAEPAGDAAVVHLATRPHGSGAISVLSLAAEDGHFPSIARHHPGAILMERALCDLHGLAADDTPDPRPWLDHRAAYDFKPALGPGIHQIPVGPVHAGIIEPGHFRFSVNGEAVVRLEVRLGYTHKATLGLMRGQTIEHAARLAGRISGDSTVAYAFAFARAAEQALGIAAPPRAAALRGVMAELERLANHFGDIGAICNDGGFPLMHALTAGLRERVLRLSAACFGHRLMMDIIIPGGVARDLSADNAALLRAGLPDLLAQWRRLFELYEKTASLQDRVTTTGRLDPAIARRLGCGGYVGRASGQDFDARRDAPYPPYDTARFVVPGRTGGDVDARLRIRMAELDQSAALIDNLLAALPHGALQTALPTPAGSTTGHALIEGFRGDIFAHVRLHDGVVVDAMLRDPSWFFWPALETAIAGNIVADFPLCNKSFNPSYSGCDL